MRAVACARSAADGQTHPVVGLWPVSLRGALRAALLAGERKIDRWTARHGCAHADWSAEPVDPFFNANAPEDLAEAERLLAAAGGQPLQAAAASPIAGPHNASGRAPS